ncbi:hypothetical protein SH661x_002893 [Planctomicrobium sp. SH661]|uniref:hypothetical protein n=1 Tax=Planctomicrobium sp. SH661 TaxID=3448124 RepID=UPI003F5B063A
MSKFNVTRSQDYLSVTEFSVASTLSESTIRRRIKDGTFQVWQPGGPGTRVLLSASLLEQAAEVSPKPARSPVQVSKPASSPHLPGPRLRWKKR